MKHHVTVALALACFVAALGERVSAQGRPTNGMRNRQFGPPPQEFVEELPPGGATQQGPVVDGYHDEYPGGEFGSGEFYPHEHGGGYYPDGCGDPCGCDSPGCYDPGGAGCEMLGCYPTGGRCFFFADYLYVRSNFSQAVSYAEREELSAPRLTTDTFRELEFEYDSSYRFGGGYRCGGCGGCGGQEIRVLFTRLSSFADAVAPDEAFLPFDPVPLDDEQAQIHSFVSINSYDLEYRKTIQLGGGCGDPCCGDACGSGYSTWDVTWSGGFRFAEADWNRSYSVVDDEGAFAREFGSFLNFEGGGPRFGVEGRYYGGQGGWFSIFLKGDMSLLLGQMDLDLRRRVEDGVPGNASDDIFVVQSIRNRQIVPVTEVEAGVSANITCHSMITAGYLFSAWHDLGFRDEFNFTPALETHYDDANILGFDGFFARLEVAY